MAIQRCMLLNGRINRNPKMKQYEAQNKSR